MVRTTAHTQLHSSDLLHVSPAIQAAHLSGFSPIITTASLHNTELLTGLGATHVLDRKLSSAALLEEVRKITGAPIKVIYDAISLADTQNAAYDILAPGGQLIIVLALAVEPSKISPDKEVKNTYGSVWSSNTRKIGASLWSALTPLLEDGSIKVRVLSSCIQETYSCRVAQPCGGFVWWTQWDCGRVGKTQERSSQRPQACRAPMGNCMKFCQP